MTATEAMERTTAAGDGNANKTQSAERAEGSAAEAKAAGAAAATTGSSAGRDQRPSATGGAADEARKKKRRKVNHACLYCRRSHMTCDLERPCTRCIKRNIGHLCHDEPRDSDSKKSKSLAPSTIQDTASQPDKSQPGAGASGGRTMRPPSFDAAAMNNGSQAARSAFEVLAAARGGNATNPLQLVQPTPVSGMAAASALSGLSQFPGFSDAWLASQNPFHDMHSFHSNFVIAPEVTNEFNLLNDFLQTSLLVDDGALLGDDRQAQQGSSTLGIPNNNNRTAESGAMPPPGGADTTNQNAEHGKSISRPGSVMPTDKTREYYLQAADPSGNATPEERMRQVLQAKYEAGLLKPFNYVKGYTRLQNYLDTHVAPASKQKILRQLDRFRPKFREKMKDLTDVDLVLVEMWFERTLLDMDRVFASMAVPACCWRRTGEIFRGNKEMAELIKVPVEDLRGGKIALHEILTEESNVRYWEEFGTIAFDPAHDTLLTACSLKSPREGVNHVVNCCFSFRIRRDEHKIPSLIIGNFLPHDPDPDQ